MTNRFKLFSLVLMSCWSAASHAHGSHEALQQSSGTLHGLIAVILHPLLEINLLSVLLTVSIALALWCSIRLSAKPGIFAKIKLQIGRMRRVEW